VVFYPNYFRWFDRAAHELLRQLGMPVASMLEKGFATPLVESHCRFLVPVVYDDELDILSRVEEIRTRAFRLGHSISRGGEPVAEGYEVRIWVRMESKKTSRLHAAPIPDDLRRALSGASDG
jgi:YbgC/YbaW family acyl-CoA thioester hydrolase